MSASDLLAAHARQRARRTASSPVEYAAAIEVHKRGASLVDRLVWIVLVLGLVAALWAGAAT